MRKNIIFILGLLVVASFAKAQSDTFADRAQILNSMFDLAYGENQELELSGVGADKKACKVYVSNETKINPSFPESSKRSQSIDILIQTGTQSSKFFLRRVSNVKTFDLQNGTAGASLYIKANNKTGVANFRKIQQARILKGPEASPSLVVQVADFDRKWVTCTIQL